MQGVVEEAHCHCLHYTRVHQPIFGYRWVCLLGADKRISPKKVVLSNILNATFGN